MLSASEILEYAWRMLIQCHELLTALEKPTDRIFYNAIVESRLLHTRQLVELFFRCNRRPDEIHVSRWFSPESKEYLYFADSKYRRRCWEEKADIGKYLAHMTEARIRETVKGYGPGVINMFDELMRKFVEFAGERIGPGLMSTAQSAVITYSDPAVGASGKPGGRRVS